MCGICGVMALEGTLDPTLRAGVRAMNAAIAYRGPDGDGFHDGGQATLGHRRLAIIDRAGGAQPMANEDGTCWIVFNGEVYNHRGLRPVLEGRGHRFRTHSDTEAILHAWEEYGTSCVDHLEGMFAFAIYDERRRELFIARDRLGKKPLFYGTFGGTLHFASELGALRRVPVARILPRAVHGVPGRAQAGARVLAARGEWPRHHGTVLGRDGVRHRHA
jgi:asparagine synthase (glutamine-hydrolysing)